MKSYKYRTGSAALRSLSEGSLYFASPNSLNDILEAQFDLADGPAFLDCMVDAWQELAKQRGLPDSFETSKENQSELDSVVGDENAKFKKFCQGMGIFASSIRADNQPLWAYYANEFKGVCFELEWSKEVLENNQLVPSPAVYTNEPRIHNRAFDAKQCLIEIGTNNPDWSLAQIQEYSLTEEFRRKWGVLTAARAVSIKHSDWAHEQEIRLLSPRPGAYPILQSVLKRVYFVKSDFAEFISIVRLIHQLYPGVELIQLSFNHTNPLVTAKKIELKRIPANEL